MAETPMTDGGTATAASAPTAGAATQGSGAVATREWVVTWALCAAAAAALALVIFTAPGRPEAAEFDLEGQPLLPSLADPHRAAAIEITGWSDDTATATPFKVERKDGRWQLPSHAGYPAEAKDRLIKITANVIGLQRGALQSRSARDHEALAVIDPLDGKPGVSLKGRGLRCTLRDDAGAVLADFVVGKDVPGRDDFKYLRMIGDDTTWAVNLKDVDLSSSFYDWIEKDLLKVESWKIRKIEIDPYHVDEQRGILVPGQIVTITKPTSTNQWVVEELQAGEKVNDTRINEIVDAIDDLEIADVKRKPPGVTGALKVATGQVIPQQELADLQLKGFFLTERGLVSNDGEVRAWDEEGVLYTLRFGELAPSPEKDKERRYVFVTAIFDTDYLPEPVEPPKPGGQALAPVPTKPGDEPPGGGPAAGDGDKKDEGGDKKDDGPGGEKKDEGGEKKDEGAGGEQPAEPPKEPAPPKDQAPGGGGNDLLQDEHGHDDDDAAKPGDAEDPVKKAHDEWQRTHDEWKRKSESGQKRAKELNDRFADWYYVIPGETYKKLKARRDDVVEKKDGEKPK